MARFRNKIVIYAHNGHNSTWGNWDLELANYLLNNRCRDFLHVRFPFDNGMYKSIRLFFYKNGIKERMLESFVKFDRPEIVSYVKDLLYGFFYGFKYLENTDLFVGTNNLLIMIGLFFRKIGYVKEVAYVVIDYTPIRFSNRFFNLLYYFFDRIACHNSDVVWPLDKKMLKGRHDDKKIDLRKVNYIEAPSGNNSLNIRDIDYNNYDKNWIVYFGSVIKNKGSEIFIPLVKSLLANGFSSLRFYVIGGGDIDFLKKEVLANNLSDHIIVLGRIESEAEINNILLKCAVAIAPYYPYDKNNYSYYADPGKIKIYLGCGLPVVITDVPPIAKELAENRAGLIANYEANDFADKILNILANYEFYRENAIKFGKEFDWNIIFSQLFTDN